ncbi:hypothetical protein ACH5RR_018154 [Cinchona calisaya]|uniref:Uncharacterized protein n=1 Tax=Cinchona calisaya TaxID=153742 RepID=A0ABD2ZP96_9GENT
MYASSSSCVMQQHHSERSQLQVLQSSLWQGYQRSCSGSFQCQRINRFGYRKTQMKNPSSALTSYVSFARESEQSIEEKRDGCSFAEIIKCLDITLTIGEGVTAGGGVKESWRAEKC